ncbi:hypothetical protein DFS34DRAFT_590934 [Phlyctochytrium arcticum]|nr:hypothetical protein DFS34DRAFT_590934 [Phlyctochytrium arcticum]
MSNASKTSRATPANSASLDQPLVTKGLASALENAPLASATDWPSLLNHQLPNMASFAGLAAIALQALVSRKMEKPLLVAFFARRFITWSGSMEMMRGKVGSKGLRSGTYGTAKKSKPSTAIIAMYFSTFIRASHSQNGFLYRLLEMPAHARRPAIVSRRVLLRGLPQILISSSCNKNNRLRILWNCTQANAKIPDFTSLEIYCEPSELSESITLWCRPRMLIADREHNDLCTAKGVSGLMIAYGRAVLTATSSKHPSAQVREKNRGNNPVATNSFL